MSSAMANRIVVFCPHTRGNRARVTARRDHVLLEYGSFDREGIFRASDAEMLPYVQHEELLGIFQEDAWDVIILAALVDTFCED